MLTMMTAAAWWWWRRQSSSSTFWQTPCSHFWETSGGSTACACVALCRWNFRYGTGSTLLGRAPACACVALCRWNFRYGTGSTLLGRAPFLSDFAYLLCTQTRNWFDTVVVSASFALLFVSTGNGCASPPCNFPFPFGDGTRLCPAEHF
jgi:hypothetical protein